MTIDTTHSPVLRRPYLLPTVVGYTLYVGAFLAGMGLTSALLEAPLCDSRLCGYLLTPALLLYVGFLLAVLGVFMIAPRRMDCGAWLQRWFAALMCGGMCAIARAAQIAISATT